MNEQPKKIYVVEDEKNILNVVELVVKSLRHEVYGFTSGEAALADISASCPDLIITDYRMPGGMNGVEFIQAVRETVTRTVPIILISGDRYAQGQLRTSVSNLDRIEFVPKPFDTRAIAAQIKRMLLESEPKEKNH